MKVGADFAQVGELTRVEAEHIVVGYRFNLKTNELVPEKIRNPAAGRRHTFRAWRVKGAPPHGVTMQSLEAVKKELELEAEKDDE
ncbi:MAG: hypothetical protein ACT4P4_16130 [Betaproteobacteria bacterium]